MGALLRFFKRLILLVRRKFKSTWPKPRFSIGDSVIFTLVKNPPFKGFIISNGHKYEDSIGLSDFKFYRYEVRFRVKMDGRKARVFYAFSENTLRRCRTLLLEKVPDYSI